MPIHWFMAVGSGPYDVLLNHNLRVDASLKFGELLKPTSHRDSRAAGVHSGPRMVAMFEN